MVFDFAHMLVIAPIVSPAREAHSASICSLRDMIWKLMGSLTAVLMSSLVEPFRQFGAARSVKSEFLLKTIRVRALLPCAAEHLTGVRKSSLRLICGLVANSHGSQFLMASLPCQNNQEIKLNGWNWSVPSRRDVCFRDSLVKTRQSAPPNKGALASIPMPYKSSHSA